MSLLTGISNYEEIFRRNLTEGVIHNSLFSIIARFGLFAVTPFLLLLSKIIKKARQINGDKTWWYPVFISWGFFSMFLQGLFETYLIMAFLGIVTLKLDKEGSLGS